MPLLNILLTDSGQQSFLPMLQLREEIELLICKNINTINQRNENANLVIQTIDFHFQDSELTKEGWKRDSGLYDRLIIEYNNRPDTTKLLDRWKRG